eukprot:jgi/Tetstr1/448717/TSEL_035954.t1
MGRRNSKHRIPEGKEGWTPATGTWEAAIKRELRELLDADIDVDSDAEGKVAGVVEGNPSDDNRSDGDGEGDAGAGYDFSIGTNSARGKRRELYTGADATLMEAALNLCEWKLKHNIKTAAFEGLSKLLKKHCYQRTGLDQDFPSLPMWRPCLVGQWEAAGADDAVDLFEGTGPGCKGAAVEPSTSGAPATWTDCEVALAKYYQGA